MDVAGTRTVVQILNADETKSYANVLGIPDYKLKTPEKTEISFYEAQPGTPLPLRAWFYPGNGIPTFSSIIALSSSGASAAMVVEHGSVARHGVRSAK